MELTEQIAYFAGLVDGEGTIQIIRQTNGGRSKRPPYFTTGFFVTNSNRLLLDWIQERFGGNITKARQHQGKNWKPVFRIQFYGDLADKLIRMVQPYLVAKRGQAELYLELRGRMHIYKHPLSVEERAIREQLWLKSKHLNRRGIGQAERTSEEAPQYIEDDAMFRPPKKNNSENQQETAGRLRVIA